MQYALGLYEKAMPANLGWEEMLLSAKEAGFDHLEISIDEGDARLARLQWSARQREDLYGLMYKTGMPIKTMCLRGHRNTLGQSAPATRARSIDIMRSALIWRPTWAYGSSSWRYDVYYGKAMRRASRSLQRT